MALVRIVCPTFPGNIGSTPLVHLALVRWDQLLSTVGNCPQLFSSRHSYSFPSCSGAVGPLLFVKRGILNTLHAWFILDIVIVASESDPDKPSSLALTLPPPFTPSVCTFTPSEYCMDCSEALLHLEDQLTSSRQVCWLSAAPRSSH
jgi:hypothetical protein